MHPMSFIGSGIELVKDRCRAPVGEYDSRRCCITLSPTLHLPKSAGVVSGEVSFLLSQTDVAKEYASKSTLIQSRAANLQPLVGPRRVISTS